MKISVIIPTYERPKLLAEALESVMLQTELPGEIIIGDDSGNNQTQDFIQKFNSKSDFKVHYYHHKPALKQGRNVDFLLNRVNHELVLLLHDDDLLLPNCLEVLIEPLKNHPEVVASFGMQYFIKENGEIIDKSLEWNAKYFKNPANEGIVQGEWASIVQMLPNDGFLMRSNVAKQIGYYGNGRGGDAVDFYFSYRLAKNRKFFFVNQFTSSYRVCEQSISSSRSTEFMSPIVKILLHDLNNNLENLPVIKKKLKELMNPAISEVIRGGDKKTAIKWMLSEYYNLFSLRGLKRIFMLMIPRLLYRKLLV